MKGGIDMQDRKLALADFRNRKGTHVTFSRTAASRLCSFEDHDLSNVAAWVKLNGLTRMVMIGSEYLTFLVRSLLRTSCPYRVISAILKATILILQPSFSFMLTLK